MLYQSPVEDAEISERLHGYLRSTIQRVPILLEKWQVIQGILISTKRSQSFCDHGLPYRESSYSWENSQPYRGSPFSLEDGDPSPYVIMVVMSEFPKLCKFSPT